MEGLGIVAIAVLGAVLYGIAHDLVTTRISIEYFTIGHPKVVESEDPTTLALVWGVLATWWVGVALGLLWAAVARLGGRPRLRAGEFLRPAAILFGSAAIAAAIAGVVGHALAASGGVVLLEPLATRVPGDRHVAFLTDLWIHLASYAVGAIGGIVVAVWAWRRRGRVERA